ncbi:MAG: ACT domain-containing protein [Acidobacteriia bacterium]|nr:ACT domain-containing protein [Terriglobia bacterium]
MKNTLTLSVLPGRFAVCRLAGQAEVPGWASRGSFVSITRAPGELSIVCAEENIPAGIVAERGWKLLGVRGPLEFTLTGILAGLAGPLAEAGISIFAISTYETDYLLVGEAVLEKAIGVLERAGHTILREGEE